MKHNDILKESAVFAKGRGQEYNCNLAFCLTARGTGTGLLRIAVANLYRLHINGKFVAYGPARTAEGYARVDEIPFAFENGQAEIVFEVVNYYMRNFYLQKEQGFFACTVEVDGRVAYTSRDFTCLSLTDRAVRVQRYGYQRPSVELYRQEKCRTALYAGDRSAYPTEEVEAVPCPALLPRDVPYPTFTPASAREVERGGMTVDPALPVWQDRCIDLVGTVLEGYRREECEEMISDTVSRFTYRKGGKETDGRYTVFAFDRSLAGFLTLRVRTRTGVSLYAIYDEIDFRDEAEKAKSEEINVSFSRNDTCNVIKWELAPGEYELTAFEAMQMRYVRVVEVDGEAEILSLGLIRYENADIYRLTHRIADARLSAILDAAQNTLSQNSVDLLTDCPSRERAGWPNDSYFTSEAEFLLSGKRQADHNLLENYLLCPQVSSLPRGMLPMCYPGYLLDGMYIPNCELWLIMDFHKYLTRSGDRSRLPEMQEKVRNILSAMARFENEDGLLEDLESWVFVEWSRANDPDYVAGVNYPSNMMYYRALQCAAEILDEPALAKKAEGVRAVILRDSYNGEFFEDNRLRVDGRLTLAGHITETCQYYAFFFGVATRQSHAALYRRLIEQFGPKRDVARVYPDIAPSNMIIGLYMRQDLLMQDGDIARMYDEECAVFYRMASETGTLWEHLSLKCSLNHGFASYCAVWILYMLTGYRGVRDGRAVFARGNIGVDCEIKLPIGNEYLTATVKDGHLTVSGTVPYLLEEETPYV